MPGVVKHVDECAPDLARRSEYMIVIAVGKDPSGSVELTVEPACDADEEPLESTSQRLTIGSLANQMDVVRLN